MELKKFFVREIMPLVAVFIVVAVFIALLWVQI